MNKTLYILRSVSGAGKTTLATTLKESLPYAVAYAADDYHYDSEGNYNFKLENLSAGHKRCQEMVKFSMETSAPNIIVHNTNTTEKEIKPYLFLAEEYGYKVVSLVVENRHGSKNVHDVPADVLKNQEQRLRHSLKLT
ncbi:ATPase [Vibrio phage 5P1c]